MTTVELKEILKIKDQKKKEAMLRKASYIDKNDYELLYALAKELSKLNRKQDNKELLYLLDEVIHNSNNIELVHKAKRKKAKFLCSIGEYRYAEHLLSEVLNENENDFKAIMDLGDLKVKTYEIEQAKICYKYALKSENRDKRQRAYESIIKLYIDEDCEKALFYLNKMIDDPKSKKYSNFINFSFARIYRKKGEYKKAVEYIDKVAGLQNAYGTFLAEKLYIYSEAFEEEKFNDTLEKMSSHNKVEYNLCIEEALMNISLSNKNFFDANLHKNKVLKLISAYKRVYNDYLK